MHAGRQPNSKHDWYLCPRTKRTDDDTTKTYVTLPCQYRSYFPNGSVEVGNATMKMILPQRT